ncbi:MAG: ATP-binding protein [Deltaproteobacteria bacterium]|nr:ATP-binding protein [Deltaproteobacteria bacterium]
MALLAKQNLRLPSALKKLSKHDALIIDDIGYVEQNREEMEVLFILLGDRYEKRSVMITSNLPFSNFTFSNQLHNFAKELPISRSL